MPCTSSGLPLIRNWPPYTKTRPRTVAGTVSRAPASASRTRVLVATTAGWYPPGSSPSRQITMAAGSVESSCARSWTAVTLSIPVSRSPKCATRARSTACDSPTARRAVPRRLIFFRIASHSVGEQRRGRATSMAPGTNGQSHRRGRGRRNISQTVHANTPKMRRSAPSSPVTVQNPRRRVWPADVGPPQRAHLARPTPRP